MRGDPVRPPVHFVVVPLAQLVLNVTLPPRQTACICDALTEGVLGRGKVVIVYALLSLVQPLIVHAAFIVTLLLTAKLMVFPILFPVQPTLPPEHPEVESITIELIQVVEPGPEIVGDIGLYLTVRVMVLLFALRQRLVPSQAALNV